MGNKNFSVAKKLKNDEFYTYYEDIHKELNHYNKFFEDRIVLCNADDPEWSNFWRYFHQNFHLLKLKKLISTHYNVAGGPSYALIYEGEGDVHDFQIGTRVDLIGNGDFNSPECIAYLEECDIVCTNPPFSLFRKYVDVLMEHKKDFVIIGSKNSVTYKSFFPYIKNNRIFVGYNSVKKFKQPDGTDKMFGNVGWFTTLDIDRIHEPFFKETEWHSFYEGNEDSYPHYDNFNAIEVNRVDRIPRDYTGLMGVPVSYLDSHNSDDFEVVGITKTWNGLASKIYDRQVQVNRDGKESIVTKLNDGAVLKVESPPKNKTYYVVDGKFYIQTYPRLLIRNLRPMTKEEEDLLWS